MLSTARLAMPATAQKAKIFAVAGIANLAFHRAAHVPFTIEAGAVGKGHAANILAF